MKIAARFIFASGIIAIAIVCFTGAVEIGILHPEGLSFGDRAIALLPTGIGLMAFALGIRIACDYD